MIRLLVLAALLGLAGCAGSADAGEPPDVTGGWQLVSGESAGSALALPPGRTATLLVEEQQLRGSAFCNSYSAGYSLDGETLGVGDLASTEMGCEPPVLAAEAQFLGALGAVDHAARDGAELVLTGGDVTLRFVRQVPVPDRALDGTRWVLDTLVDGDTASSAQGEPTLVLSADGSAGYTTGCNGTSGRWRRDGDVITLEPGASTLVGCAPSAQGQERQVDEVLTGGATVTIDGERLTLTAADGRALGYRAG